MSFRKLLPLLALLVVAAPTVLLGTRTSHSQGMNPSVSLMVDKTTISEASETVTFTVISGVPSGYTGTFTVPYKLTGTATYLADYRRHPVSNGLPPPSTGAFTFGGTNGNYQSLTLVSQPDTIGEDPETIVFELEAGSGYTLPQPSSSTVTLTDTTGNTCKITSPAAYSVHPAGEQLTIEAEAGPPSRVTKVDFYHGTTLIDTDSSGPAFSVNWTPNLIGTVNLKAVATFYNSQAQTTSTVESALVPITIKPKVTLSVTDGTAAEPTNPPMGQNPQPPSDTGMIRITRTGPTTSALLVQAGITSGGTGWATNGEDVESVPAPVTLLAGASYVDLPVIPEHDRAIEGEETLQYVLNSSGDYVLGSTTQGQVVIQDNDLPEVSVAATDLSAAECLSDYGTYTFTRDGPTLNPLNVNFTMGGTAVNADYQSLGGSVTIPGGSSTATLELRPSADTLVESAETAILTVTALAGSYTVGSPPSATVTIADAIPPTVALTMPVSGQVFNLGTVPMAATAMATHGPIQSVEFLKGTEVLGQDNSAPYTFNWNATTPGIYTLYARATDNCGVKGTSAGVTIRINAPPTVSITAPSQGEGLPADEPFILKASASDTDGSVTQVQFFRDGTSLGVVNAATNGSWNLPVSASIDNMGEWNVTARATDNDGASKDSDPRRFGVLLDVGEMGDEDMCGCSCPVSAQSAIDPRTGGLTWDVPVTSWSYRGLQLGLSFHYSSLSHVGPQYNEVNAQQVLNAPPNTSRLSERNSRWTHNWAQSVEVVWQDNEMQAVWNQGGSILGFRQQGEQWESPRSTVAMTSARTPPLLTAQVPVKVPGGGTFNVFRQAAYSSFQITQQDGTVYSFSTVHAEKGVNQVRFVYLLTTVTDRHGRQVTLTWTDGKLMAVKDPAGRGLDLAYNPLSGLLTSVTDRWGRVHELFYTGVTDETGANRQKLTKVWVRGAKDGTGARPTYEWEFAYGTATGDLVTQKEEPAGKLVTYTYEPAVLPRLEPEHWDGRVTSSQYTDASDPTYPNGLVRRYELNRATGTMTVPGPNPVGTQVQYTYDSHHLVKVEDLATQRWVAYEHDGHLDDRLKKVFTSKAGPSTPVMEYAYVPVDGDLPTTQITATNPLGETTVTQLGVFGLPMRVSAKSHGTPARPAQTYDQVVELDLNPANGKLMHVWRKGVHPQVPVPPSATGALSQLKLYYASPYALDSPTKVEETALIPGTGVPVTLPAGEVEYLASILPLDMDAREDGRLWKSSSPANPLAAAGSADLASSITQVLEWTTDGLPLRVMDAKGHEVTFAYLLDSFGRLKITTQQAGAAPKDLAESWTVVDKAGNTVESGAVTARATSGTWTRKQVTTAVFNGEGQPLVVTESGLINGGATTSRSTRYRYDAAGNLLTLTPPNGVVNPANPGLDQTMFQTHFEYWGYDTQGLATGVYEGQVTQIVHPDGFTERFGYDAAGALAWHRRKHTQGTGGMQVTLWAATEYTYDDLGRVTEVFVPPGLQAGTPGGMTFQYRYDEFGRVYEVEDGTGISKTFYDALDRPTRLEPGGGRKALDLTYFPNAYGWETRALLAGQTLPWVSEQDPKGRTWKITTPFSQVFTYKFDLNGNRTELKRRNPRPNNQFAEWRTVWQYDVQDRLTEIRHRDATDALLDRFTYEHDAAGRVTKETDDGARVHTYVYDPLGQLQAETHPDLGSGNSFSYDKNGNRTQVTQNGLTHYYKHDEADKLKWINNAALGAGGETPDPWTTPGTSFTRYDYDDWGQMTRRDRKRTNGTRVDNRFEWDGDGRLRRATQGAQATEVFKATYDAGGQRVWKEDAPTGEHRYSHGLHDSHQDTYYTPGHSVRYTPPGDSAKHRFTHDDYLGTMRYLMDGTGTTVSSAMRYSAYGKREAVGGEEPRSPYQFAGGHGYEREPYGGGLDLVYLEQRYYEQDSGRFLTRDPIRWAGGLNLYGYTGNDPVNRVDPSGLAPKGHHYIPQSIWKDLPLRPEVRSFLDSARTGPIPGGHNFTQHGTYNDAVEALWDGYLCKRKLAPQDLKLSDVENIYYGVRKSRNPIITNYLKTFVTARYLGTRMGPPMGIARKALRVPTMTVASRIGRVIRVFVTVGSRSRALPPVWGYLAEPIANRFFMTEEESWRDFQRPRYNPLTNSTSTVH